MTINVEKLNERIDHLCKEKGIKKTAAFVESGVGKNFQSNMKTAKPTLGKLTLLANYFKVSVEYLTGESEKKESQSLNWLSKEEYEVLSLFNSLSPEQKLSLKALLDSFGEKK